MENNIIFFIASNLVGLDLAVLNIIKGRFCIKLNGGLGEPGGGWGGGGAFLGGVKECARILVMVILTNADFALCLSQTNIQISELMVLYFSLIGNKRWEGTHQGIVKLYKLHVQ